MTWVKWAAGEALCRALSMTLMKIVGGVAYHFPHLILSTAVIGGVQTAGALLFLRSRRIAVHTERRLVVGSVCFGIGAFFGTLIPFLAYQQGANLVVYSFLTLLSIIPSACIDRIFFGQRMTLRQWCGIGVALTAGWMVLRTPNLTSLRELPLWAWLALLNACSTAANQGISRAIKDVDPWVKNFWGGLTTTLLSVGALTILSNAPIDWSGTSRVLLWSLLLGVLVIGIWSYNVIAYRDGAAIAPKHVVVYGLFMCFVALAGWSIFGEAIETVQWLGMAMYAAAFTLVHNETWEHLRSRLCAT